MLIIFSWNSLVPPTHRLNFSSSRVANSSALDILTVAIGQGYSLTITMTPDALLMYTAWNVYMNAQHVMSAPNLAYPQGHSRSTAYFVAK